MCYLCREGIIKVYGLCLSMVCKQEIDEFIQIKKYCSSNLVCN